MVTLESVFRVICWRVTTAVESCSTPLSPPPTRYAPPVRSRRASQLTLSRRLQRTGGRNPGSHIFPPEPRKRVRARAKKCLPVSLPILFPEVIRRAQLLRCDHFPADILKCL